MVCFQDFTYWARPWSGPLGPVGRGHCLALRGDGKWDSFRCPNKFPYLCEKGNVLMIQQNFKTFYFIQELH